MVHVRAVYEIAKIQNVKCFITFVCIDPNTKKKRPHNIILDETDILKIFTI